MEEKTFWEKHPRLSKFFDNHPCVMFLLYLLGLYVIVKTLMLTGCNPGSRTYYDPDAGDYYTQGPD